MNTLGNINSTSDFLVALQVGPYAWPGGYQQYLLCADGEALCFTCGHAEAALIIDSIAGDADGWKVVSCEINYEDRDLRCVNCNEKIPAVIYL